MFRSTRRTSKGVRGVQRFDCMAKATDQNQIGQVRVAWTEVGAICSPSGPPTCRTGGKLTYTGSPVT